MERNYRERNRYYRDNYDDYPRNTDKNRNRSYKLEDNYRNRDKPKDYKNRNIYNYNNRDDKYRDREKIMYNDNYSNKYRDRDDHYYENRKYNKDDDYRKYSRSRSRNKYRNKDYYRERDRDKLIDMLEGEKNRDDDRYKYKRRDNWRRKSRKRSSSSSNSTIKREQAKKDKETNKEKEKEPFVSAFTNFPFQLPEEITKNENYQKLYNNNNNTLNNTSSNTNANNSSLFNNPNNNLIANSNLINRASITNQFSLYTNPYLVQSLALLPTAQNTDKKLYIGNLPNGMTPPSLIKMLNIALLTLKPEDFSPGEPVISAWVSPDGHYAFVEFRTAEEATKGFILNGFKIIDTPLKVGRPKTYQGLSQNTEEIGPSNTVAAILMKNKKNIQLKTYKFVMPTTVLCLNSIIKGLDIEDEDKYNEVKEDIMNECEKYGKVLDIFMPRKDVEDNATPGMGNAYVMYENIEQSKLARRFLSLKRFNNKSIYIQYIPEENFFNKKFEPII